MEAKQAVALAKKYLLEVMTDETIDPPTLEEIWFEEKKAVWKVTIGIRRKFPGESPAGRIGLSALPDYKIVTLSNKDGRIVSVKDRLTDS